MGELICGDALLQRLRTKPPLVEGAIDAAAQLQVNGFDLTVRSVLSIEGAGAIGFSNEDRHLPSAVEIEFDQRGWTYLPPGPYKIIFNEIVNLPLDIVGIALPRSSLLRMGVSIHTAFWDAGYCGRSESLLIVHNPQGLHLRRDARVVQMGFLALSAPPQQGYTGRYLGENLSTT